MRRMLLASAGLVALTAAAPALAADLGPRNYTKAPAYVAPLPPTWAGFYLGVNAGYGFGDRDDAITTGQALANVNNVNGGARPGRVRLERDGFVGGGQLGYNWQFGGVVLGFETDIQYTDLRDNVTVTTLNLPGAAVGPNAPLANTYRQELEYLGTVRGRLGYSFDRTLVYATGGFAYGGVRQSVDLFGPNVAPVNGALQFTGSRSNTETGYTVGGGIEQLITPSISIKAEYLYYDLGNTTVASNVIAGSGGGGTGYNVRFRNDGSIVRAGLNFKFNSFGGY